MLTMIKLRVEIRRITPTLVVECTTCDWRGTYACDKPIALNTIMMRATGHARVQHGRNVTMGDIINSVAPDLTERDEATQRDAYDWTNYDVQYAS